MSYLLFSYLSQQFQYLTPMFFDSIYTIYRFQATIDNFSEVSTEFIVVFYYCRFNICRESVKETRAICNVLINKVFRPAVARKDKDFFTMADHLAKGMWAMNPILDTNAYLVIMHNFLKPLPSQDNNNACRKNNAKSIQNNNADEFITLTLWERNKLMITYASLYYIRFTYARIFYNYLIYLSLWLMKVCPFLAYYMFGFRDSHVRV